MNNHSLAYFIKRYYHIILMHFWLVFHIQLGVSRTGNWELGVSRTP